MILIVKALEGSRDLLRALYNSAKVRWQLYYTLFTSHNWPHLMAPGPGAEEGWSNIGTGAELFN